MQRKLISSEKEGGRIVQRRTSTMQWDNSKTVDNRVGGREQCGGTLVHQYKSGEVQ